MDTQLLPINLVARRLRLPAKWLQSEADADRIPCLRAGAKTLAIPEDVADALISRVRTQREEVPNG